MLFQSSKILPRAIEYEPSCDIPNDVVVSVATETPMFTSIQLTEISKLIV